MLLLKTDRRTNFHSSCLRTTKIAGRIELSIWSELRQSFSHHAAMMAPGGESAKSAVEYGRL